MKNIQEFINYLEYIKKQLGTETEIKIGSESIEDFEDFIMVDDIRDEITISYI